ncbi:tyrosinase-like [Dendropsophus ebraccatus]|uniref:tyrosinase-like n=1 Tax=Dendropsophus ebraccatus TaxID=150705 RepID=UPI003831049E
MLALGVLVLCLAVADAFLFPRECVQGKTSFPVVCCPSFNGSQCGAAYNRGSCLPTASSRATGPPTVTMDERHLFPKYFFSYICKCKGNYDGFNCGECTFNRYGDTCEKTYPNVRREIRELNDTERERYFAQLHYCKSKLDPDSCILRAGDRFRNNTYQFIDASYYDIFCFGHYYATKPFINNTQENFIPNFAHSGSGFPTWHRLYLLALEKQLQKCLKDPTFTLVYYDWGRDSKCEICNDTYLAGNDDQGYLSKWSIFSKWRLVCGNFDLDATLCLMSDCECERTKITRNPGGTPGFGKPGADDIQYCLDLKNYDQPPYNTRSQQSARNCLEGWVTRNETSGTSMHNLWHVYCGGTMAQVPISCNDFMFVVHHVFVDKLLDRMITINKFNPSSYPSDNNMYGHGAYDCIIPSYRCWRHRDMLVPLLQYGVGYSIFNGF